MIEKVNYEFKTDKRGSKYALRVNVKSGKKKRINYKLAQKRHRDLVSKRKRTRVIKQLEESGTGASYKEYRDVIQQVDAEIRAKHKKDKKPLPSNAQIRSRAKKTAIEYRTGVACRYRYAWIYWMGVGYDDKGRIVCDSTPVMEAGALKRNGQRDYETMVEVCKDVYDRIQKGIKSGDICDVGEHKVQGGLCVTLYEKNDKSVIDRYEKGEGCGYSFDWKGYEKDR